MLSSCLATAQVTVRGRVSDKDGKALQGTFIKVDGTIRGVADAAGEYAIELTKGQYKLSAYLLGFGEKQLVVRVGISRLGKTLSWKRTTNYSERSLSVLLPIRR